mmetsp:Transcript_295/g.1100  ORF Transcript_295/g.1100 Transcript_295/m.1100 type:complete len:279 (-) Transcript_295:125-961(-)
MSSCRRPTLSSLSASSNGTRPKASSASIRKGTASAHAAASPPDASSIARPRAWRATPATTSALTESRSEFEEDEENDGSDRPWRSRSSTSLATRRAARASTDSSLAVAEDPCRRRPPSDSGVIVRGITSARSGRHRDTSTGQPWSSRVLSSTRPRPWTTIRASGPTLTADVSATRASRPLVARSNATATSPTLTVIVRFARSFASARPWAPSSTTRIASGASSSCAATAAASAAIVSVEDTYGSSQSLIFSLFSRSTTAFSSGDNNREVSPMSFLPSC